MIKTIIKLALLSVVILLLGQVPVGNRPVAQHLVDAVSGTLSQSTQALEKNEYVGRLARGMRTAQAPKIDPRAKTAPQQETLTDADRESLRRLLQ